MKERRNRIKRRIRIIIIIIIRNGAKTISLPNLDLMSNVYRRPSKEASYQVSIHLAKRFQRRRFFLEINQSETKIACGGHVC
jgi:hypothetical protein